LALCDVHDGAAWAGPANSLPEETGDTLIMSSATASILRPIRLPELDLHIPADLDELLAQLASGTHPFAGGTDILLWASQRGEPRRLVWTGGIGALHAFEPEGDPIEVGAAVPLSRVVRSAALRAGAPAVAEGAQSIGSVQLRNQGTLVGNVCTASPAGDTLPGLLVHDARVEILGPSGNRRRLDLKDFLLGPGRTALEPGELVAGVSLSRLGPREASSFLRFTQRQSLDLAIASVAARIGLEADGHTVRAARLALGAVAPTAIEAEEAAAMLVGGPITEGGLRACAEAAAEACAPISDHRASADYRRHLVRTLVRDAIEASRRRAQGTRDP
jgi:CO/xanthine dehydrogenase FAD-binding subunit